jgi:prepilin peptidase CpaA
MDATRYVFLIGALTLTATAAVLDARWKRLPNLLNVTAFALGIAFNVGSGAVATGWTGAGRGLLFSAAGFGVGFGILLVLWLIGGGGGGDVKFMGALGAWLGPMLTFKVLVGATLIAGVLAMYVLAQEAVRRGLGRTRQRYLTTAASQTPRRHGSNASGGRRSRSGRRRLLPFAVPVAVATWLLLGLATFTGWPPLPV